MYAVFLPTTTLPRLFKMVNNLVTATVLTLVFIMTYRKEEPENDPCTSSKSPDLLLLECSKQRLQCYFTESDQKNLQKVVKEFNNDPERQEFLWLTKGPIQGDDRRVVDYLLEDYLVPPSTLPYNFSTDGVYKAESKKGSQYILNYLQRLFGDERDKFFVESGALDGEYLSNTLWLEMNRGWTGLLIEPDEDSYSDLLLKRRKAWVSNTCLSVHSYPMETVHVGVRLKKDTLHQNLKWNYRGMSHGLDVNLNHTYASQYLLQMADETYQRVQCFPLVSYLKALNVTTVDLLVLDMQGAEKGVLRALPWPDLTIRVMLVELTDNSPDLAFHEYIRAKGYYLIEDKVLTEDYIFVKNGDSVLDKLFSSNT